MSEEKGGVNITVRDIDVETGNTFSGKDDNGSREKYKLFGVEVPGKGEPGFDEAKNALTKLIGNTAIISFNETYRGKVFTMHEVRAMTEDGTSVTEKMREKGYTL